MMHDFKKIDKILLLCDEETSLKDISDMLGWRDGSTSISINHLIKKGHMKKTRRGFYQTTKKGHDALKEILSFKEDNVTDVAIRAAELIINPRFSVIRILKHNTVKPNSLTKKLGGILKKVYVESVNHNSADMIKCIWRHQKSHTCKKHGFDFEKPYKKYESEIKKIDIPDYRLNKTKLFRNLRWESFSDIQKLKMHFGLIKSVEIPGQ